MKYNAWNKRIPTIFALITIGIGIWITTFFVQKGIPFIGTASPSNIPQNIEIANITQDSFTVSYTTAKSVVGMISFGRDTNIGQIVIDDRDKNTETIAEHAVHHITIINLTPSTHYFFSIKSGQEAFLDNGRLFEVTTAPVFSTKSESQKILKGTVVFPDTEQFKEAIVYTQTENSQKLSTTVNSDGTYSLPLSKLRKSDLSTLEPISDSTVFTLSVITHQEKSQITVSGTDIGDIPAILFSQNYDFSDRGSDAIPSSSSSELKESIGFPLSSARTGDRPSILSPKRNEEFVDQQPLFQGTAETGEQITITIHSDENIQATITTDKGGTWSFRPQKPLSPGQHTIAIATKDKFGVLQTITRIFTIFAPGVQVAQAATPSATPIISPSLSLSPSPTLIIIATTTPTLTPTPTQIPTPTALPIPTNISIPTPLPTITSRPQDPGNSLFVVVVGATIVITSAGLLLFLRIKRSTL